MSWQIVKLGDVCNFVRGPFGGSLKKEYFVEDGYAVYEQQHAIYNQFNSIRYFVNQKKFDELKRFELKHGDLIMSCSGTMGKVAIVPKVAKKGLINQALLKLTPSPNLNIFFLKRYMESSEFQLALSNETHGAAIKNVASVGILKSLKIKLPPLAEQQRIATILDKAELVKRKRELAIEKLDSLAESIFLEIYKKSNNTLEVALDTVLVGVKNCNPTSLFGKSSFTYIDIGAVNNLSKAIVSPQVINGIDAPSRARQVILEGDVLISTVRPNLNCVALVDEDYINPVASTGFCVLRCDHEKILPEFLFLLVRSKKFIQNLVNQATGASYPAVSDKIIKASKLNLPSIELQKEFEKKIKKISNQKIKLKNQNRKLNKLLDSLQSQAFSGKQ